jgi:hypothetical protein
MKRAEDNFYMLKTDKRLKNPAALAAYRAYQAEWKKQHPDRVAGYRQARKADAIERTYGISMADYNAMFAEQEGRCVICGRHQSAFRRSLCVDHDHVTGEVRGLLCTNCNALLGHCRDDVEVLLAAIQYIGGKA